MGKRSNFERREADFYPTPLDAVVPLIPYLSSVKSFAEPCAGNGDLVRHLESVGLACVYSGDIRSGQDALALDHYGAADVIITNPPWSRNLMHRLIAHFQSIRPTWLLLDADWAHTKQAAPFLPYATDIVAIGRVKWIEGSKHTGKENCAWYRFSVDHAGGPIFHPKGSTPELRFRLCEHCRNAYEPQRSSSRFCSERCRQRAHRNRLRVTSSVTAARPGSSAVCRYVRHADVARFEADGWERLPPLDHTRSALMRRRDRD
ncbi:hypothetical protein [Bradyrhizobium sp. RT3a]|uniref:hypothetical protein n=1 Tax=unclassified Bradyrhizobium TaxID=2631580 RepID=UPI003395D00F